MPKIENIDAYINHFLCLQSNASGRFFFLLQTYINFVEQPLRLFSL